MTQIQTEQELYDKLNEYRKQLRTGALTTFDIQGFVENYQVHDIEPKRVYKHIAIGNACSWATYEIACAHYEKYKRST